MRSQINTLALVIFIVAALPFAMSSCNEKQQPKPKPKLLESSGVVKEKRVKELAKKRQVKPKTAGLLIDFEKLFQDQEKAIEVEETAKKVEQHEIMTQTALNQTIEELLKLDPDKDTKRVQQLIADLKAIGEPATEVLLPMLDQKLKSKQRRIVIMALGELKGKGYSEELYMRAVADDDAQVRKEALAALKKAQDKDAIASQSAAEIDAAQAEGTKQSKKDMRAHIAALGAVGGEVAVDKLYDIVRTSDDPTLRKDAVRALGDTSSDAAKRILIDLYEYDAELRSDAAQALGRWGGEDMVTLFGEALLDASSPEDKRRAAVAGLGIVQSDLAREMLANVLRDKRQSREIHKQVVDVLVGSKKPIEREEVARLIIVYESTPVEYLPQMMQPLLAKGGDVSVELIKARFSRFKQLKKIHAVRTLGRVQSERTFEVLVAMLETEKDSTVRREVLGTMKRFKAKKFHAAMKEYLIAVAKNAKDPQERIVALNYLADIAKADAAGLAELNLTIHENKALVVASIDVLKKFGSYDNRNALLAFKLQTTDPAFAKRVDEAVKAIEAREQ